MISDKRAKARKILDFIGSNRIRGASPRGADNLTQKLFSKILSSRTLPRISHDSRKSAQPERKQSIVNEIPGIGPVNEIGIAQ